MCNNTNEMGSLCVLQALLTFESSILTSWLIKLEDFTSKLLITNWLQQSECALTLA